MASYNIGDIVRFSGDDRVIYYMITDILDFEKENGESNEKADVYYVISSVYPVGSRVSKTSLDSSLIMVARDKSFDHRLLVEYIEKERIKKGKVEDGLADTFGGYEVAFDVAVNSPTSTKNNNDKTAIHKKVEKFGEEEIQGILEDNHGDLMVEEYEGKMNTYLELLLKAINEGDEEEAKLQKERLEEVRKVLLGLDYFQLEKRRDGISIKTR